MPGSPERSEVQPCCPCEVTTHFHSKHSTLKAMMMVQELWDTHRHSTRRATSAQTWACAGEATWGPERSSPSMPGSSGLPDWLPWGASGWHSPR